MINILQSESGKILQPESGKILDFQDQARESGGIHYVTNWKDPRFDYDFTQATAAYQPKLIQNAINDYPAVEFNGSSYRLIGSGMWLNIRLQDRVMMFVAKKGGATGINRFMFSKSIAAAGRWYIQAIHLLS